MIFDRTERVDRGDCQLVGPRRGKVVDSLDVNRGARLVGQNAPVARVHNELRRLEGVLVVIELDNALEGLTLGAVPALGLGYDFLEHQLVPVEAIRVVVVEVDPVDDVVRCKRSGARRHDR
jgi:hypothetical protein